MTDFIRAAGVRVHNLKSIDVSIPIGKLTVLTGVSGSGKSSLAFDTLYAEGQRRYLESFSAYARQHLPKFDRPAADSIENIPPAIAIAQHVGSLGRGMAAAAAGVLDYIKLAFAHGSTTVCPKCQQSVIRPTPEAIRRDLGAVPAAANVTIAFVIDPADFDDPDDLVALLREQGFLRIERNGTIVRLDDPAMKSVDLRDPIRVLVDRLAATKLADSRFSESIETALRHGADGVHVQVGDQWRTYSERLRCPKCATEFLDPEPSLFQTSNPLAICPACHGECETREKKPKGKSTKAKAIDAPSACSECDGSGFRWEVLAHRLGARNFAETLRLTIDEAIEFFSGLEELKTESALFYRRVVEPLIRRLGVLADVGLGYLTLGRDASSLSTGESQRVVLTRALGSGLSQTLFVLDEPTAGLHPQDVDAIIACLQRLRTEGNTVVVVEHDRSVIRSAEWIVDLGPGAGAEGGNVLYSGSIDGLEHSVRSTTAQYLELPVIDSSQQRKPRGRLRLEGARAHNLQDVHATFPLHCLCVVAGVSGAGKSSLVMESLLPALHAVHSGQALPSNVGTLTGAELVDEVIRLDAEAIGRSLRSNPATYLKIFDEVRQQFAEMLEAKVRGLGASAFSFNLPEGRCERCEGAGVLTVDMQFLPEATVACPDCGGARFQQRVLEVKYRGRNIAETLDLTIREAFAFFRGRTKVQEKLETLIGVGLEYLRLGQPLTTLSGGELQRLKLANYLGPNHGRRCLFVLEEPSSGLHPADIESLLGCLDGLIEAGHSIILIDHRPDLWSVADHLIEVGPGAGAAGGRIIAEGTPTEVARCDTPVGRILATMLQ